MKIVKKIFEIFEQIINLTGFAKRYLFITFASGVASGYIQLNVGGNTLSVVVTAQKGTEKTYTLTINRHEAPPAPPPAVNPLAGDASLSVLVIVDGGVDANYITVL